MDKKKVNISIVGTQCMPDGNTEKTELYTEGILQSTDAGFSLKYQESEMTGMEGTETEFLVEDHAIILRRTGAFQSLMRFSPGELDIGSYNTPYGALAVETTTHHIQSDLRENGGSLRFSYTLSVEGETVGEYDFLITVKKEDKEL